MSFYYLRDIKTFTRKPTDQEIKGIKSRLGDPNRQVQCSIEQLAQDCLKYSIAPIEADNFSKNEEGNWAALNKGHLKSQQLIFVDIDNNAPVYEVDEKGEEHNLYKKKVDDEHYLSIERALEICSEQEIEPVFLYKTFSHDELHHRFRIVFVLDEEITDPEYRDKVVIALHELFQIDGYVLPDIGAAKDRGRVFYPGKELLNENHKARINAQQILEKAVVLHNNVELRKLYYIIDQDGTERTKAKDVMPPEQGIDANERVEAIRNADVKQVQNQLREVLSSELLNSGSSDNSESYSTYELLTALFHNRSREFNTSSTSTGKKITMDECSQLLPDTEKPVNTADLDEFKHLLKQIPLHLFLDLPSGNLNCLFHDDSRPSAKISYSTETESWRYFCNSDNCNFGHGDIIDIVKKLQQADYGGALDFLSEVLEVRCTSQWQREKQELIDRYIQALQDRETLKDRYPHLHGQLWQHLDKLTGVLEIAKEYIFHTSITGDSNFVFSISTRELSRRLQEKGIRGTTYGKTFVSRIVLFHMFGLLIKLSDEDIPENRLDAAKEKSTFKNEQGREIQATRRTNFFKVPDFSSDLLKEADDHAKKFKEEKLSRAALSYEQMRRLFGKDEADLIYPQEKERKPSQKVDDFYNNLQKTAQNKIDQNGYTTRKELIKSLRGYFYPTKERRVKELVPELLKRENLQEVKASKDLKKRYKIKAEGYPNIIIRKSE